MTGALGLSTSKCSGFDDGMAAGRLMRGIFNPEPPQPAKREDSGEKRRERRVGLRLLPRGFHDAIYRQSESVGGFSRNRLFSRL